MVIKVILNPKALLFLAKFQVLIKTAVFVCKQKAYTVIPAHIVAEGTSWTLHGLDLRWSGPKY